MGTIVSLFWGCFKNETVHEVKRITGRCSTCNNIRFIPDEIKVRRKESLNLQTFTFSEEEKNN